MARHKWAAALDALYHAALPTAEGRIGNVVPASKGLVPRCYRAHRAGLLDRGSLRVS